MRIFLIIFILFVNINIAVSQKKVTIDSAIIPKINYSFTIYNKGAYYYLPYKGNSFMSYSSSNKYIDSIKLETGKKGIAGFEVGCYRLLNNGLCLITDNFKDIISFDYNGRLMAKSPIKSKYKKRSYVLTYFNGYNTDWPLSYNDNYFLLKCFREKSLNSAWGAKEIQEQHRYLVQDCIVAKVDSSGKIVNVFGRRPYNQNLPDKKNIYLSDYYFNLGYDGHVFIDYEHMPQIDIYDVNGILVDSFGVPGRHITYKNETIPLRDKADQLTYNMHYWIENPQYRSVIPMGKDYVIRFYTDGIKDLSGFTEKYAEEKRSFFLKKVNGCRIPTKIDDEQIRIYYQEKMFFYQLYQKKNEKYILIEDEPLNKSHVIVIGATEDKVVFRTTESRMEDGLKTYELKIQTNP